MKFPKRMNSQFTLISGNIPLTKWKLHCLVFFPVSFSWDLHFSNSIGTLMSVLYVLLPLLLDLVLLSTIYLIFPLLWNSAHIHNLLDCCWLFCLCFFFGFCVYLWSHLPCTFDGWVLILDFLFIGFFFLFTSSSSHPKDETSSPKHRSENFQNSTVFTGHVIECKNLWDVF
jgi:hypothetical protein